MRYVMVRYRIKPDRVDENEALVRGVYAELASLAPPGLRYATLKLPDGVSFVHIAESDEGQTPLSGLAAFQRFQEGIGERCDEPPVVSDLTPVGAYRLFGG
ncbi:MAG TPA: hypothetical protein VGI72_06000 [Gaiellales bacterium]